MMGTLGEVLYGIAVLMGLVQGGLNAVAMLRQLDRTLLFELPAKLV